MTVDKKGTTKVRIFQSALNNVVYKYGRPLPVTKENLKLVEDGKL